MGELNEIEKSGIIEKFICNYFGFTPIEIYERTRRRSVVKYRQILFYMVKRHTSLVLREIGEMPKKHDLKQFDHASILHSIKTVSNEMETSAEMRNIILMLEPVLTNLLKNDENKDVVNMKLDLLMIIRNNHSKSELQNQLSIMLSKTYKKLDYKTFSLESMQQAV